MPDVIVIGDINADVILTIPAYPLPGGEAVAANVQIHTGGSALNTAVALSKMDMSVGFIGRIGQDALASQVLVDLQDSGVDCSRVQIDSRVSTGLIFVAVTVDGERTMFGARGANIFTEANAIDADYFAHCRWLHLSGYSFLSYHQHEAILFALKLAKNSPYTRVSLDIGTEPALRARSQIMEILPQIDVIFPNETELTILGEGRSVDDSLDYLLERRANAIVAKCGSKGSILAVGNKRARLPAFDVPVKDSTGAGDNFNAGVVLGRLVGLSWEASAALGNALGGMATSHDGGGANYLTRNSVARLIEKHLFREEWIEMQSALEELTAYFEGTL
jgi:ribokinase